MATGLLLGATNDTWESGGGGCTNAMIDKWTALATGKVTEIKVKVSVAGTVKLCIYADSGGEPGALLSAVNTGQSVSVGWNTITLPTEVNVTKDTVYWIGFYGSVTSGMFYFRVLAGRTNRWKAATYSSWTWPNPAGSGWNTQNDYEYANRGWGILVISPSGLSQPIAYGTPKLSLSIKPPGYQQAVAYGTPTVTVETAGITIYSPGLEVVITYGSPLLSYPQTISPPGLNVPIAYGMPSVGIAQIVISPQGIAVIISYGTPTILKYVFHLILDGQYNIESPETNRAYVIGRDIYGNPVWGEAHDTDESALVGERLDFQPDPAIPTTARAADVASAVLSKMRLGKKRGVILIPYNCGQELWDVVQITDAGANQSAVKFRVVGLRFEYHPKQARYQHRLILGAP